MIRVRKITLRNWRRVREAVVEFPESGTIAVIGRRSGQTSDHMMSSGSGKTSLGEAVSRSLFGIPADPADELSYLGRGNTYVRVDGVIADRPMTVEWGYKCRELGGTGEMLRYTVGDEIICRGNISDTRAELTATLGIPDLVAGWSVFLDGEALKFNKLSQAQQVELLMQALRQPPWPAYHKMALKHAEEVTGRETLAVGSLQSGREAVEDAEEEEGRAWAALEVAQKEFTETSKDYVRTSATYAKSLAAADIANKKALTLQRAVYKELNEVTQTAQKTAREAFAAEMARALDDQKKFKDEVRKKREKLVEARTKLQQLKTQLSNFGTRSDKCTTCGQAWPDAAHRQAEVDKITAKISECREDLATWEKAVNEAELLEQEAQDSITQIREKIEARTEKLTHEVGVRYDKATIAAEQARDDLTLLQEGSPVKPDERALEQAKTRHQTTIAAHVRAKEKLEASAQKLAEAERDRSLARYWTEALGPNGIPNQILENALAPLNQAAAIAGHALSGGAINVAFSATRELASGQQRSKLTVNVSNPLGAHKLGGFSKGERGLTNLIISESLVMIGQLSQRCSWRWLDEPINNQDRRHVYSYFQRQARQHNMAIFIVDHHPEARELADYVLTAIKDSNGYTTYAWE